MVRIHGIYIYRLYPHPHTVYTPDTITSPLYSTLADTAFYDIRLTSVLPAVAEHRRVIYIVLEYVTCKKNPSR